MIWFDNWFAAQCRKAWNNSRVEHDPTPRKRRGTHIAAVDLKSSNDFEMDDRKSYTIRMQPATGGTVVEVSHYDDTAGEWNKDLYIVPDNKEFSSELTSIMVQYKLRHG